MSSTRARFLLLAAAASLAAVGATASPPSSRFFFSGDGTLAFRHAHRDERLMVRYRDASGRYDPAALAQIDRFFRSRTDGEAGSISLRLIELIDFVQDRYRPTALTLLSGYRSRDLNQELRRAGVRAAKSSLHTEGLAADVQLDGVDLRRAWNELRELRAGGVGLYEHDGFLHLDTGRPRFWEPATSRVEEDLSAGNARLFARTDFDRYADLQNAVITLHAVTALPIAISRDARLGDRTAALAPVSAGIRTAGDCYVIDEPAERYAFRVVTTAAPPSHRTAVRLRTCEPRTGATPKEVETNAIER